MPIPQSVLLPKGMLRGPTGSPQAGIAGLPEQGQPCPSPAVTFVLTFSAPGTPQLAQISGLLPQTPGLLQGVDLLPSSSARSLSEPRCRQNNVSEKNYFFPCTLWPACPWPVSLSARWPGGASLFPGCLHIVIGVCARCLDHAAWLCVLPVQPARAKEQIRSHPV